MASLLKILFIAITILWLIKQLVRFILPVLIVKWANKVQNQANRQYQNYKQPDNKIRVDYVPPSKNKSDNIVGDFVDYEEVK